MTQQNRPSLKRALGAKRLFFSEFLKRADLLAMGIGFVSKDGKLSDEHCVKVYVRQKLHTSQLPAGQILPKSIPAGDGASIRLDIEEMNPILSPPGHSTITSGLAGWGNVIYGGRTLARRPLAGAGGSYVHFPAGTIGAGLRRREDDTSRHRYLVSCNHVFAYFNRAPLGSPIVQPCPLDGGTYPRDAVANLQRFVPLRFGSFAINRMDAAISMTVNELGADPVVRGLGPLTGVATPQSIEVSEPVWRLGRSNDYSAGRVLAVHAAVRVNYWTLGVPNSQAVFDDQLITDCLGEFGDSGSVLVNSQSEAVGLLFGGSRSHTLFNYFHLICTTFELTI